MSAARPQFTEQDVAEPSRLVRVLNETLLELAARLEALENMKGVHVLPEVTFETGGALAPTTAPFGITAGVRISCPFSPTGLLLLHLAPERSQTISALASDVKWHYAAGPNAGTGVLHIDFVTGLLINTRYRMRVGVTRA